MRVHRRQDPLHRRGSGDGREADPQGARLRRPAAPFGTGYYEAYNKPAVQLVDINETPIVRITETGIETSEGHQEFDIIIWATGYDFGTGALNRLGVRGRRGLPWRSTGRTGRRPISG